jgi:hypothetical protein
MFCAQIDGNPPIAPDPAAGLAVVDTPLKSAAIHPRHAGVQKMHFQHSAADTSSKR